MWARDEHQILVGCLLRDAFHHFGEALNTYTPTSSSEDVQASGPA